MNWSINHAYPNFIGYSFSHQHEEKKDIFLPLNPGDSVHLKKDYDTFKVLVESVEGRILSGKVLSIDIGPIGRPGLQAQRITRGDNIEFEHVHIFNICHSEHAT